MDTVLSSDYIKQFLKPRPRDCNKGDFGKLLIIASCASMSGAATIAARAALRSGVGLCAVASTQSALLPLKISTPEAITMPLSETVDGAICKDALNTILDYAKGCSAAVLGCGLSVCEDTEILVKGLLRNLSIPIVLDADGINIAARNITILRDTSAPLILTPHLKEMSRLTGKSVCEIKENKGEFALKFARENNVILVLKDFETVIASPDGNMSICNEGHPCMAKGGSGDMLSGMIGAFLAQGLSPKASCEVAVYLHAKAGNLCGLKMGDYSVLASDMTEILPEVFQSI